MACVRLTFDEASELIIKWYYAMRVDCLKDDELDWELESRLIVIDDKLSLSQKRKWLRNSLKNEKQISDRILVGIMKGDVKHEIHTCLQKFNDLKVKWQTLDKNDEKNMYIARLLHLGARMVVILTSARGSPNLHSNLQNMLVEVVEILEPELNKPQQNETESGRTTPEDNDQVGNTLTVIQTNPHGAAKTPTTRPTVLDQEDLDWIHSLQARIVDLEFELQRRKGIEVATQTFTEIPVHQEQPRLGYNNPDHYFPWSLPYHQPSIPSLGDLHRSHGETSFDNRFSIPHNNPPAHSTFPISSHNPHVNRPTIGSLPQQQSYPTQTFHQPVQQPIPSQAHYPSFPNSYPQNHYSVPHQTRHTLPVSKWNIEKYSGNDQGLKLNEFLEHVQALSQAERVSDRELFESAVHLFAGSALKWYMTQRSIGRLMNWQHLVFELRRTYMHPDLDALIKMKIYQRRQQKHESFHEFYFEMEKLFRTMSSQIPDSEKMQLLQQNMRIDYKRQMTFLPIADLETLVAAGQKLDALNFSAYNKVFGMDKTVQAISHKEAGIKKKQRELQSQPDSHGSDQTASVSAPSQFIQGRSNRPSNPPTNPTLKQNPTNNPRPEPSNTQTRNGSKDSSYIPQAGSSGSQHRPALTLEDVVNNHTPPPNNTCFNCGRFGHHTVMCRQPRGTFCNTCGLRGFPTDFCPYCVKNGSTANENRRPQGPQA